MKTPCYVICCNPTLPNAIVYVDETGWQEMVERAIPNHATYEDERVEDRRAIVADIRRHRDRNGIPLYTVSDHGNVRKVRRVTLRSLR